MVWRRLVRESLASRMHLIVRHQSLAEEEGGQRGSGEGRPCVDDVGWGEVGREDESQTLLGITSEG
jgi:hypothetical protein